MSSTPHPEEPTAGDYDRAAQFVSDVRRQRIDSGLYVTQLAHLLADERAAERERQDAAADMRQSDARARAERRGYRLPYPQITHRHEEHAR